MRLRCSALAGDVRVRGEEWGDRASFSFVASIRSDGKTRVRARVRSFDRPDPSSDFVLNVVTSLPSFRTGPPPFVH